MAQTIKLTPGAVATSADMITPALLNLLANPVIELEGSIGAASIADNSVTQPKLIDGILTADTPGRAKMADGYVTTAKLLDALLSADAAGRAKMADGFLTYAKLASDAKTTGAAPGGSYGALTVNVNASTPLSKVDVTATDLVLKDSGGVPVTVQAALTGIDITVSGANGLDTGAEAGSTWYYIWVIYNGTTVSGLLSVSATAPTLPGGYTYKALVGAVRNGPPGGTATDFWAFYQSGNQVWTNEGVVFTATAGVTAYTALNLAGFVPDKAKAVRGTMGTTTGSRGIGVAMDANGLGGVTFNALATGTPLGVWTASGPYRVGIKTAHTVYWQASDTTASYRLTVSGWEY
jgi:hypothetical protein